MYAVDATWPCGETPGHQFVLDDDTFIKSLLADNRHIFSKSYSDYFRLSEK